MYTIVLNGRGEKVGFTLNWRPEQSEYQGVFIKTLRKIYSEPENIPSNLVKYG
jgi:hypothetical protein